MTISVASGYRMPRVRTHRRCANMTMAMPHHNDQPACIDGIAAYWLDRFCRSPDAMEPQVSCSTTVSKNGPSGCSRGVDSGKTKMPISDIPEVNARSGLTTTTHTCVILYRHA